MGKGKHFKEEEKNYKKIIRIILIILLIISSIYIGIFIWNSNKEQKETDELLDGISVDSNKITATPEIQSQKTEKMLKVEKLKEEYPDVVAWIEIEGTNINYPVMQGRDNEFYMNHDYKKEESIRGSIFLDKDYDWSIPYTNLLIYGHNNSKDGTMFADLLKYKDKNFYKEHPMIKFTTPNEDAEYEIISVFLSRVYYQTEQNVFRYYYFLNAENEDQFDQYILNSKIASLYYTGKSAEYGDKLITLSTCEYSQEDGRLVVVARKKQ